MLNLLFISKSFHISARFGGIIPTVAMDFHRNCIENVVNQTFRRANVSLSEIDAIAVTNRPGLSLSLLVGVRYAKYLSKRYNKPIIPIHHMEAHALMARMTNKIPLPFLCVLLSGGHSLVTFVKNPSEFYLLGETLDDAPGEAFDKIARRLKLRNLPQYAYVSGGQAIELAATSSRDPSKYEFPLPLSMQRDCQFSFAGLKNTGARHILKEEKLLDLAPDAVLPDYEDFCASFLNATSKHILQRTRRAIVFCEKMFLKSNKLRSIVVSGGVARNDVLFNTISGMAKQYDIETFRPQKQHCTDNGIMIAWNGVELLLTNEQILHYDDIEVFSRAPFKINLIQNVKEESIPNKA
ncbi:probable tRNA N6-adenosine threonylcarbamoyltransferase, mitochondrial isoform X2 [Toxorhynchites rutilus septentrionalis]|uniref:probable tRNA N6-adenosine threonylcarbamoyltransferase, mitochondrial isoform X2 n=1 Tax=Toxorhynchites rutilus septentrionalis TaxID=329112 RepID=UPI002478D739|nr:probable tRNA N6-adenosine threonylcarbamoyltransferase, mitochondrial isoform X2 [Toxorhynchites rutilus septentrionalis]